MSNQHLYSVGYATKPIEKFIEQLKYTGVNVIADVRSVPYSNYFQDYHRETLIQTLKQHNIRYVYLGDELGPRSKDPTHYDENGQVQFNRLMQSPLFVKGIERLQQGVAKGFNIALMCAEKDPAICHRSLLIGYALSRQYDLELIHIRYDGTLEKQSKLEARLVEEQSIKPDLFLSEESLEDCAYHERLKATSYRKPQSKTSEY